MTKIFEIEIPGRAYVKKNTQRVVGRGRGKRVIYSPKYTAWANHAVYEMKRAIGFIHPDFPHKGPTRLEMIFTFKDKSGQSDLSNLLEGPQDCLVNAGIIEDDKQVYSFDGSTKRYGGPPSVLIRVYALDYEN